MAATIENIAAFGFVIIPTDLSFLHEVEEHAVLVYLANVYIHDAEYEFE